MYNRKLNEELTTKELLYRLLTYHTNVMLDNFRSDTNLDDKIQNEEEYMKCLREMVDRIEGENRKKEP